MSKNKLIAKLSKTEICQQVTHLEGKTKTNEYISNKNQKGSIPIFQDNNLNSKPSVEVYCIQELELYLELGRLILY